MTMQKYRVRAWGSSGGYRPIPAKSAADAATAYVKKYAPMVDPINLAVQEPDGKVVHAHCFEGLGQTRVVLTHPGPEYTERDAETPVEYRVKSWMSEEPFLTYETMSPADAALAYLKATERALPLDLAVLGPNENWIQVHCWRGPEHLCAAESRDPDANATTTAIMKNFKNTRLAELIENETYYVYEGPYGGSEYSPETSYRARNHFEAAMMEYVQKHWRGDEERHGYNVWVRQARESKDKSWEISVRVKNGALEVETTGVPAGASDEEIDRIKDLEYRTNKEKITPDLYELLIPPKAGKTKNLGDIRVFKIWEGQRYGSDSLIVLADSLREAITLSEEKGITVWGVEEVPMDRGVELRQEPF